jgi:hypothetical protein
MLLFRKKQKSKERLIIFCRCVATLHAPDCGVKFAVRDRCRRRKLPDPKDWLRGKRGGHRMRLRNGIVEGIEERGREWRRDHEEKARADARRQARSGAAHLNV